MHKIWIVRGIMDIGITKLKIFLIFFGTKLTQADLTERLPSINHQLAEQARQVLDVNKAERHIRGGMATRDKYLCKHQQ